MKHARCAEDGVFVVVLLLITCFPSQGRGEQPACRATQFGCCADQVTPAKGYNSLGCPDIMDMDMDITNTVLDDCKLTILFRYKMNTLLSHAGLITDKWLVTSHHFFLCVCFCGYNI